MNILEVKDKTGKKVLCVSEEGIVYVNNKRYFTGYSLLKALRIMADNINGRDEADWWKE